MPNTNPINLLANETANELAVASTGTAYSKSFMLSPKKSFSLELQLDVSSGTPDVKVELEAGGSAPDTEGSSDTDFTVPRALGGGANADCTIDSGVNTELVRFYPLPPVVAPYQRFKLTGQGSNPASCKVVRMIVHEIEG